MVDEEVAAVRATDGAADPGQRHGGALEGRGGQGGGPPPKIYYVLTRPSLTDLFPKIYFW